MCKTIEKLIGGYLKLKPPTTPKGCRSFAGMVNCVSIFFPELQKQLKPLIRLLSLFVYMRNKTGIAETK